MTEEDNVNLEVARRWCDSRGAGWKLLTTAGRGGTAPVFKVLSPNGEVALKLYDEAFSTGVRGEESEKRVAQQVALGSHDCPYLIQILDGGKFEGRYFVLMNVAPGQELEKRLLDVPRSKIRQIVNQVVEAVIYLRDRGLCHRDIKSANIFVSDDFELATLLDLSVIREISDPVGIGTDHDGQLPVVATSRYCSPEYLFRLIEPSPELWGALDIYQMGGLLHDLIMREPLFEEQYKLSKENRYRFAWIVATETPEVAADDVDGDLLMLARKALDKDVSRRSQLSLDDFRDSAQTQRILGLEAIGFVKKPSPTVKKSPFASPGNLTKLATDIEEGVLTYLRQNRITAHHHTGHGSHDHEKRVTFNWETSASAGTSGRQIELGLTVATQNGDAGVVLAVGTSMKTVDEGTEKVVEINLPPFPEMEDIADVIAAEIISTLGELARRLAAAE